MAGTLGGKITLDISEFTQKITRANQLIRENESQWRQSASALGDWTKTEDGLNSRLTTLNKQIEEQKNILTILNEKKRVLIEEYGAESKQVDAVNKEIAKYGKALDGSYKEMNSVTSSLEKLTKTEKSDNVSRETLTKTIDKQTTEVKEQKEAQDTLNNSVAKATEGYTVLKNVLANLITNGIQKLTTAVRNVVNLVNTLPASTEQTRKTLIQLETAFESAGFTIQTARNAYVNFKAVLGDASTDIKTTASLVASLSETESDMYDWVDALAGVYAKLGNAFPTQELLKNIQQTANTGKSTQNLTTILDNAGYSSEEFYAKLEKMTTQSERLEFIQSVLNELYGEAGRIYQKNNKALIESTKATERQQIALSRFGDALQPIKTQFTEAKTDVLDALADLLAGVDGAENDLAYSLGYLLGSVGSTLTALKDLIASIWDKIKESLIKWWDENKETLKTKLKAVWASIKTSFTEWWDENGEDLKAKVKEFILSMFNIDETTLGDALKVGLFAVLLASLLGGKGIMIGAGLALLGWLIGSLWPNEEDKERLRKTTEEIGNTVEKALGDWAKGKDFWEQFFTDRYTAETEAKAQLKGQQMANLLTEEVNSKLAEGIDFQTALEEAVEKLNLGDTLREELQEKLDKAFNKELVINPKVKVNYTIEEVNSWTDEELEEKKEELKNSLIPKLTLDEESTTFMNGVMEDMADNAFASFANKYADSEKQAELSITWVKLWRNFKKDLENDAGFSEALGDLASLTWLTLKLGFETIDNGLGGFWNWIKTNIFGIPSGVNTIKPSEVTTVKPKVTVKPEVALTDSWTDDFKAWLKKQYGEAILEAVDDGTFDTLEAIKKYIAETGKNPIITNKVDVSSVGPQARADDEIKILGTVASTGGRAVGELITQDTTQSIDNALEVVASNVEEKTQTNVVDSFVDGWMDGINGKQSKLSQNTAESIKQVVATATEESEEPAKETFGQWIKRVWQSMKDGLPQFAEDLRDGLTQVFEIAGMVDMDDTAEDVAGKMYSSLSSALKTAGGWGQLAGAIIDLYNQVMSMSDEELEQWAEDLANLLVDALVRIVQDLPRIVKFAITLIKEIGLALAKALPDLMAQLPDIIAEIIQALLGALPQFAQVGVELIKGLFSGMWEFLKSGWNWIKNIGTAIVNGFKAIFGIHSPSQVFADNIGKNISLGIAQGIADNIDAINESLDGVNTNVSLSGTGTGRNGGAVVVNQYNSYSRQYSRYELYRTRKNTFEAVKGAMA